MGTLDGTLEGILDGVVVGRFVGELVGTHVGFVEGADVGIHVRPKMLRWGSMSGPKMVGMGSKSTLLYSMVLLLVDLLASTLG